MNPTGVAAKHYQINTKNMHVMPEELKCYIEKQPSPLENNARSILRREWDRVKHKHVSQIINYYNWKYGLDIDGDWNDKDWGTGPQQ